MLVQTPEVIVQTWRAARKQRQGIAENEVRNTLVEFNSLWNELFPAEQARIVELLVERIDLKPENLEITLKIEGLTSLYNELAQPACPQAAE